MYCYTHKTGNLAITLNKTKYFSWKSPLEICRKLQCSGNAGDVFFIKDEPDNTKDKNAIAIFADECQV